MARRIIVIGVVVGFAILFAGLLVTWMVQNRALADRESARETLRQLGQFAANYHKAVERGGKLPDIRVVPAGTYFRPELAPERRLSWVPTVLPFLNQKRQDMAPVLAKIDPTKPWDAESHQEVARKPIRILLCPARPPVVPPGEPAVTQFVGIAGVGPDAASLPLDSPRAGAFRYDTATPLSAFPDGLSNTLMYAETNYQLGPWIQGGPSTVRGLLDDPKLLGVGGQFGGIHIGGVNFGMADGGYRFFDDGMDPAVLRALATRAGGKAEGEGVTD